jgi:hypothetical protein
MHYANLVVIKPEEGEDIEEAVERAMGPHEDNGGFWDWYQIGGRWTGALDGYDPSKDPVNQHKCELCNGTGIRDDEVGKQARERNPEYKCNGCDGTGTAVAWPTGWARHEGDVMPIANLTEEQLKRFYRIVTPWGHYEHERFEPWKKDAKSMFVEQSMPTLEWLKEEFKDHLCVVVDNHS